MPLVKALVTGGTGFVGNHLIDRLLEDGATEVYVLVRNRAKARRLEGIGRVHILEGNLFSIPALPSGLEAVFHLAGLTKTFKPSEYYTVNRKGTASLLAALASLPDTPRLVHVSSFAAAGPAPAGRPGREDDPPHPVSAYGKSKLMAEEEVLACRGRFPVVILRLGAVYGPGDEDFLRYFRMIRRGFMASIGRVARPLSLCHVEDAVGAMLLAARARDVASGEVFNIAAPAPATWEEIGRAAAAVFGRRVVGLRIPLWAAYLVCAASEGISRIRRKATPLNMSKFHDMRAPGWAADVEKARRVLGFEARIGLDDGLRDTLEWYARHGLL